MANRVVSVSLVAITSAYQAQLGKAAASTKAFGASVNEASQKNRAGMDTLGLAAVALGGAILFGFGKAVSAAADFDKAMSGVSAASNATTQQMGQLREAALDAGAATAFTAGQAAEAEEALIKAGVSVADVLSGGLKGSLDLAAAGNLEVGRAAEIAATAMTQFSLAGEDVPHIADLLAAGAGKAQGEVTDLGMALNQSALVAKQTGLTIEETTAGLASFASAGLIGSDAGTSFKSMLQRLTPTSKEAAGLMDELGISAYDSQGQFIGLSEFAGNLRESLKDLTPEQRNAALATIFGSDAVRAANVLYNQGAAGIEKWTALVNDQGFASRQAGERLDNLRGDLEKLSGSIETALIKSGTAANGVLREMVQFGTAAVNVYTDLSPPVQVAATALLGVGGAAALISGAALLLIPRIAATKIALTQLGVTAAGTRTSLNLLAASAGYLFILSETLQLAEELDRKVKDEGWMAGLKEFVWPETDRPVLPEGWSGLWEEIKGLSWPDGLSRDVDGTTEALERAIGPSKSFVDAVRDAPNLFDSVSESVSDTQKPLDGFAKDAGKAKKAMLDLTGSKKEMKEWRGETVVSLGSVSRHFEKLRDKGNLTAGDIADAFEDMLEAQRDFRKNWRTVARVWGEDTDDIAKFVSERMGVDVPRAMNILADADKETLKGIKQDYRDWKKEAQRTADAIGGDFGRIGGKIKGVANEVAGLGTQLHKLPNSVDIAVKATGTQIGDGLGRISGGTAVGWAQQAIGAVAGPQYITSTYRSPAHNAAVGGSPTSYHMDASNPAADIGGSNLGAIYSYLTRFATRELINEGDHIHVADDGGWYRGPGVVAMGKGTEYFAGGLQPAHKVRDIVDSRPVQYGGRGPSGSKMMTAAFVDALRSGPFKVTGRLRLSDGTFADLDGELAQDSRRQSRIRRAQGVA